jgi:hypothetical protein
MAMLVEHHLSVGCCQQRVVLAGLTRLGALVVKVQPQLIYEA